MVGQELQVTLYLPKGSHAESFKLLAPGAKVFTAKQFRQPGKAL
jgi:hypothetical protein